jgi:hypothetical protein
MTFGEPRKFDFARQVAAAIGYVALCGFDRVSVNVFPSAERGARNAEQHFAGASDAPRSALRVPSSDPSAIGNRQSAIANSLSRVRGKKSSLQFLQNLARLEAGGAASFNESVRRGALEARQAGLAVVLSDFLDPVGYETGLTTLIGRGFQVDVVQILAPEELEPKTFGDLRLVDAETGDEREVTFGKFRLKHYQQTVQNYCGRLREYCQTRGMNYFLAASNTDLSDLLLKQLRQAEVLG